MKKIACLMICLVFSVLLLCSCSPTYENSIIKHNYEKDYNQVIVTIKSITEEGKRTHDEKGQEITPEDASYTSDEIKIYKMQLINYINAMGESYMNSGISIKQMVEYFVEQLILTELVTIEADYRLEMTEIFWSKEDIKEVQTSVYDSLDSQLNEIYNTLLEKAGKEQLSVSESTNPEDTTYPKRPIEEEEASREFVTYGKGVKHDDWYMSSVWFTELEENQHSLPGNHGDEEIRSLAREGVKRLITQIYNSAKSIINLTDEEKSQIEEEYKALKAAMNTKGAGYVYSILGKQLMVKRLYGDSAIVNQKMTMLQEYIEDGVSVSEDEIVNKYNKMLEEQINDYKFESAYDEAATGDDLVLYKAYDNYIYVKHILIPFSDAQKAQLTKIKQNSTEADYLKERANYVNNIVAYKHIDGEDDTSNPLTVAQIWSEVRAKMAMASADPREAERTFDDFIYDYNTDPGIFDKETGYAVKYKLGEDESETYMQEFADAARAFRDEGYKVGDIYDKYIVTDYGVHIMYYAADYSAGEIIGLNAFTTPGQYTKIKDYIEETLLEAAREAKFTVWRNERVYYYRNTKKVDGKEMVGMHIGTYKDLYE